MRPGERVLDPANPIAQVQSLGAFLRRAQQADEAAAQVCGLRNIGLSLRIIAAQQKDRGRGGNGGEDFGVTFGNELEPVIQHLLILGHGFARMNTDSRFQSEDCRLQIADCKTGIPEVPVLIRVNPYPKDLPKARAAEFLAEVFAVHLDDAAHLVQPRTHALSNAVTECFFAGGTARTSQCAGGLVVKIGGDDCCAIVVVSSVQDQAYRVPNPFGGLDGAQFVEHQHLSFKNGTQSFKFGGLHRIVIRILNLFQQVTVIAEQTANAFAEQFLDNANRQVRLAHTDLAYN